MCAKQYYTFKETGSGDHCGWQVRGFKGNIWAWNKLTRSSISLSAVLTVSKLKKTSISSVGVGTRFPRRQHAMVLAQI